MITRRTRYWRFRAYDVTGSIKVGVTHGNDGPAVILRLRQTGLQAFDLQTISFAEYRHFLCNSRTLKRFHSVVAPLTPVAIAGRVNALRRGMASWGWWLLTAIGVALISWLLLAVIRPY